MSRARAWLCLGLLVAWSGLWQAAFAQGPVASDDTIYLMAAERLAAGEPAGFVDNRISRVAWMVLLAGMVKLVGPHIWPFCYLDVAMGVGCVVGVYALGARLVGRRAALWGGLLFSCFPPVLRYSGIVFPDRFALCLMLLGSWLFLVAMESGGVPRWVRAGVAGAVLGVACSAKEVGLVVLVVVGVYAVYRVRPWTGGLKLAVVAMVTAGLVLGAELPFHAWWSGDALHRFRSAEVSFGPGGIHARGVSVQMLFFYPATLLANLQEVGIFGWLALAGLVLAIRARSGLMLAVLWSVLMGLFLTCGSTSLRSYQPMPHDVRFLPAMLAPLFVAVGELWERLWQAAGGVRLSLGLVLAGIVASGILTANANSRPLYWGDFPQAVEAALPLARAGECPPLLIPGMVYRKLVFEHRRMIEDATQIDLLQKDVKLAALLWPAWYQALVIPASLPRLWGFATGGDESAGEALEQYLQGGWRSMELAGRAGPIDRALGRLGLPRLHEPVVVGHVYILGRR
jgi:4-amino-4-deoxy-L-arabinose transferase-like glycosyltransferase